MPHPPLLGVTAASPALRSVKRPSFVSCLRVRRALCCKASAHAATSRPCWLARHTRSPPLTFCVPPQIYRACEVRGRIAYKRSGGSRFITHNDHWKSQIRHALYTGDRFVRCAAPGLRRGSLCGPMGGTLSLASTFRRDRGPRGAAESLDTGTAMAQAGA